MDPITAIGAVASIVQLAQTALSLSKTLYSLGSAISSAADDLHTLADDLETFSTSLTILSRQLEDSKSWYSDEVYLLTGKIIKDCAELYGKIDAILVKLGSKGKAGWKLRVKFVYKEAQIRKLMKRLRDMKSTLATILLTLQLDFQLTWLDISSSSKIQRAPEQPPQSKAIKSQNNVQGVVGSSEALSRSEDVANSPEKEFRVTLTPYEPATEVPASGDFSISLTSSNELPSIQIQEQCPVSSRGLETTKEKAGGWRSFQLSNFILQPQMENETFSANTRMPAQSLKSSSSTDSFKSAEETRIDIVHDIRALQSIMHAFRTALEILDKLVQRRVQKDQEDLYSSAKYLNTSLTRGEKEINDTHKSHWRKHGQLYTSTFTDSHTTGLQNVSSILMREVVMVLHVYSAEHEEIHRSDFESLYSWSETCRTQAIFQINKVASLIRFPPNALDSNARDHFENRQESILPIGSSNEDDWESASEDCDSSIDSNLTSGNIINSGWSWGIGLARAIGWIKKRHRPLSMKSSVVDPLLFGRVNSLNGLVHAPVGFDEVSWSSSSDFGQQSSSGVWSGNATTWATSSLQRVYPIPTVEPSQFDVAGSRVSRERLLAEVHDKHQGAESPFSVDEPVEPTPRRLLIQQAPPISSISQPLYQPVYPVKSDSNSMPRNSHSGAALTGVSGVAVGAALASTSTERRRNRSEVYMDDRRRIDSRLDNGENKDDQLGENRQDRGRKHSLSITRASGRYTGNNYRTPQLRRLHLEHREPKSRRSRENRRERERDDVSYVHLDAKVHPERGEERRERRRDERKDENLENTYSRATSDSPHVLDQSNTDVPSSDLWWEVYISFGSSHPDMFESLRTELESKVEELKAGDTLSRHMASRRVSKLMTHLSTALHDDVPELRAATDMRAKIIRVVATIDQQLGLQIATLAWGCVYAVLAKHEHEFTANGAQVPHAQEEITTLTTSFTQLLQIVGIIARYAVMENLYKQNPCLTIRADYQAAIFDLCVTILEFFAQCFELTQEGDGTRVGKCNVLVEEAKRKDKACRNFAVVIEEEEEEEEEDSDSDSDIDVDDVVNED